MTIASNITSTIISLALPAAIAPIIAWAAWVTVTVTVH